MSNFDLSDLPSQTSATGRFFRRIDWSAFWTATAISMLVYFFTLGPSVTLEDSGELAVAGDYMGVPHPPGYPIWTILSWGFARVFSFVTFRGQPTPAWSIALASAVFGALATGVTAMLITRSSADMLHDTHQEMEERDSAGDGLLCWSGGVAGSLLFAFSPVMWSQATIVEVYTLNALFLMLIFLFTYRWLRRPSVKLLWLTAFVFGLGLTNYQVLLLAALPLVVVILLRDIGLFRDVVLVAIPFLITTAVLKLGALPPKPNFPKHAALPDPAQIGPALVAPGTYIAIAIVVTIIIAAAIVMALMKEDRWDDPAVIAPGAVAAGMMLVLLVLLARVPAATDTLRPTAQIPAFEWGRYAGGFVLLVGALILLSATIPRGPMYAIAILAIEIPLVILLRKGALLGLTHPLTWWFATYVTLNFVVLGLAWLMLPNGRTVSIMVLLAELGVSFYGFMPIFSDRNPPMNWGYPRTWEGFKHAILRGQYEKIKPAGLTPDFISQLGHYFTDLRIQFTMIAAPLGFLPFTVWQFKTGQNRVRALALGMGLFLPAALLAIISKLLGVSTDGPRFDKLLVGGILLLLMVGAITIVVNQIIELTHETFSREERPLTNRITGGAVLAGGAIVILGLLFGSAGAIKYLIDELLNAKSIYDPRNVWIMIIAIIGLVLISAGVAYAAWTRPGGFRIAMDSITQKWFIATTLGFAVMSVLLIALANPKGDIQDSFIQKVKFISSHGLFALWIGYGLVFSMAFMDSLAKGRRWFRNTMIALALMLPLLPIHQNYFNDAHVRIYGAAEQNGHDFGWQFGNYQLRGAEAILEELDEDEEPLPNPTYPPAMTQGAIFFGGTDPGRFVPTYMIYSAQVRPDVFLITQNALADNTYMSVMRDLYGDDIWIPTPNDSAKAFQIYVDEVKSGKRPKNADLRIENGRVQVSGALGVMEINGILCDMIFNKNKARHDFYVEESYVIRWMFPYLTPQGLILKLNAQETEMSPEHTRNDMDFWDWYTRRLTSNRDFRRDVVAMKSFSKLRSAIAGLYAARGLLKQAETAYQESRLLYALSPEANFRLTQEVLLRQGRYNEAYEMIAHLGELDPNNVRIPGMLGHIEWLGRTQGRINELRNKMRTGRLDTEDALELAELYGQTGNPRAVVMVLEPLFKSSALPFDVYFRSARLLSGAKEYAKAAAALDLGIARMPPDLNPDDLLTVVQVYANARRPEQMVRPLAIYLQKRPNDWQAWLDLATLHLMQKSPDKAKLALQRALDLGGMEAQQKVRQNPNLKQLLGPAPPPLTGMPNIRR